MGIRDRIANSLVSMAKAVKKPDYPFTDEINYGLNPNSQNDYSVDRASMETYLRAYQNVLWVFSGVNTIATNAAMVPLKVYIDTDEGKREEIHNHPMVELFDSPNKILTRFEFFVKTFAFLELAGNCYWFLERPDSVVDQRVFGEMPIKIHIERSDLVEPKSVDKTERVAYNRKANDKVITIPMEEVVHFTHFNPFSTYSGFPTVAAGQDSLIMEMYLTTFGKKFFQNAVVPSMVFSTDTEISDAAFERFKALIERQYRGADKSHQLLLLGGGLRPIDMRPVSPSTANYRETSNMVRNKTLMNLGCYHLVALSEGKPGDAVRQAYRMFWQDTMMPRLNNVAQTLTKELLKTYPDSGNMYAEFDTRSVSGLREDFMEESLGYFRYIQSGIMTANEVRDRLGIGGDIEGGDVPGLGHLGTGSNVPANSRFSANEERRLVEDLLTNPPRNQPAPETMDAEQFQSLLENNSNGNNQTV